ncbi:hypothetical protein VNO77_16224 [Canavalia gladiata]|uniref:Uncharacterized protein n=1 Tax=Canavalia gladiata TaxID=3824 RepID=A0AAN9QRX0_CANGL
MNDRHSIKARHLSKEMTPRVSFQILKIFSVAIFALEHPAFDFIHVSNDSSPNPMHTWKYLPPTWHFSNIPHLHFVHVTNHGHRGPNPPNIFLLSRNLTSALSASPPFFHIGQAPCTFHFPQQNTTKLKSFFFFHFFQLFFFIICLSKFDLALKFNGNFTIIIIIIIMM